MSYEVNGLGTLEQAKWDKSTAKLQRDKSRAKLQVKRDG